MIVTSCFLQYVAVANKPPHHPGDIRAYSPSRSQLYANWPAILIAAMLHLAWLAISNDNTPKESITPPRPITVNWMAETRAATATPPALKAKPKPEPKFKKNIPHSDVGKPQSIVTTRSQTASATNQPISETFVAQKAPEVQRPTRPAPAASSAGTANSLSESEQPATSLPSLNADYLNNPPPAYPPQSRELGEQGKVLLRVLVNANGAVEQIMLRRSSGYERLDIAAQDAVKQWRFVPAKRGEQATTAWVVVPISFSLEG